MSKVVIQGNASGTGNFTIAAPNSNTDRTFNLPDAAGTVLTTGNQSDFPAGSVLQVVNTAKTDIFSSGAASWTEITGLNVSITPSSTNSKILISYNLSVTASAAGYSAGFRLARDSTYILYGDAIGNLQQATSYVFSDSYAYPHWHPNIIYLDSPSTTSSITYKIYGIAPYGTSYPFYINRDRLGGTTDKFGTSVSTITAMEIAG